MAINILGVGVEAGQANRQQEFGKITEYSNWSKNQFLQNGILFVYQVFGLLCPNSDKPENKRHNKERYFFQPNLFIELAIGIKIYE